jgi:hypothetical protein
MDSQNGKFKHFQLALSLCKTKKNSNFLQLWLAGFTFVSTFSSFLLQNVIFD